jgi:hypothetical protein
MDQQQQQKQTTTPTKRQQQLSEHCNSEYALHSKRPSVAIAADHINICAVSKTFTRLITKQRLLIWFINVVLLFLLLLLMLTLMFAEVAHLQLAWPAHAHHLALSSLL